MLSPLEQGIETEGPCVLYRLKVCSRSCTLGCFQRPWTMLGCRLSAKAPGLALGCWQGDGARRPGRRLCTVLILLCRAVSGREISQPFR